MLNSRGGWTLPELQFFNRFIGYCSGDNRPAVFSGKHIFNFNGQFADTNSGRVMNSCGNCSSKAC